MIRPLLYRRWPCPAVLRMGVCCASLISIGVRLNGQDTQANHPVAIAETPATAEIALPPATQPAASLGQEDLDRIAGDAALESLIDRVLALPVAEDRDIATVVSLSPEAEMTIRQDVAANHLLTRGRTSPDGQWHTVFAWIPIEHLNLNLRRVLIDHFPNVDAAQVAIAAPADSIVRASGSVSTSHRPVIGQPGWRHVDAHRKKLAERACHDDALHRALVTIRQLRLGPQQTVDDLLRAHLEFDRVVREHVKASLPTKEMIHDATGLCVLGFRLERADVIRLLARSAHEAELNVRVDFSGVQDTQLQTQWDIRAFGLLPPVQGELNVREQASVKLPAGWPGGSLQAVARAQAPDSLTTDAERRAWAERIALAEARRQLWLQLEELPWKVKTVGEFLVAHPRGPRLVQALDNLVIPTSLVVSEQATEASGAALVVECRLQLSLPMAAETLRAFEE